MAVTPTDQRVFTTPYDIDGGVRREASTQGAESIVDSLKRDAGGYLGQEVLSMRITYLGGRPRYIASLVSGNAVTINILTSNSSAISSVDGNMVRRLET